MDIKNRRMTRVVKIGTIAIGGEQPVAVQSMCATKTTDTSATIAQVQQLASAGADVIRIAVDTDADVEALRKIRDATDANLSVDLQENYRLAQTVAPLVEKIRYNPGHLHHHERDRSWRDKVREIAEIATNNDCAIRVGVNCGSVDPAIAAKFSSHDPLEPLLASATEHCDFLDEIGFTRYCVSLKDSDPKVVIEVNRRFAAVRPVVPIHLGVTEAGMPPEGIIKTRIALQPLLADGIGETLRVSLTLPADRKREEIEAGQAILDDVANGITETGELPQGKLNIISCPSCGRVENDQFVEIAMQVREATRDYVDLPITIAVMGCRVNGPGETDDADLGLWCGRGQVHLKRGGEKLGVFTMDEIIPKLIEEVGKLAKQRKV